MNELYHHGILGQKWGIRRYQNEDGTLTPEGRKRYYGSNGKLTDEGKKAERKAMNKYKSDINKVHENALRNGDEKFSNAALKYEYTWSKKDEAALRKESERIVRDYLGKHYDDPLEEILTTYDSDRKLRTKGELYVTNIIYTYG